MRNYTLKEKLWHTPLNLNVNIKGKHVTVPLDKRFLNICKHQILYGHSAELFKEGNLTVIYTRLNAPDHALISVQFEDIDIGVLAIQGRAFEETVSRDPKTNVQGLSQLAEAIISRHAVVPCIPMNAAIQMQLPSYSKLKDCKQIIRALHLSVPRPNTEFQLRCFQYLLREKLITQAKHDRPALRRRFTGLPSAHCMLKFNNNFISRMVSASSTNNLFFARSVCLNVAAAQGFSVPDEHALIGATLESVPVKTAAFELLAKVLASDKPCARVAYLDSNAQKRKIAVYALTDIHREALAAVDLTTQRPSLPCYVSFTKSNAPILLGDFTVTATKSQSPETSAKILKAGGELLMRRWMAAACNYHPELNNALCLLSRAVAPSEGSIYGYNPVPALDLWASHQNEKDSK
tara:strand:- start:16739 stop:17956 length:1218 start_codon:yes stop_codon:yes gene_type:complete